MVNNPLKGEYFLPSVVSQLLDEDKASVKVLQSPDNGTALLTAKTNRES